MKISLDLLPEQRKQEIKRRKTFRMILREEALFLLPLVLFILILFDIYYVLRVQKDTLGVQYSSQQSQDKYQQLNIYEEKFKQANAIDKVLRKIQSGHLRWVGLFRQVSDVTPDGIYISNLSTKNYAVFLAGKAQTRDNLLDFKTRLEENECFQDINVPLSNLVVKNDIDFQIDFTFNEKCLKNENSLN
jgi:Tfp pilus assembly protein PilN